MKIYVNSIQLHYKVDGNGPTLLCLHGNGEDLHVFDEFTSAFKNKYTIYQIDSRGHGLSERGKEVLSIPLLAKDIVNFITALHLSNVILIGFSDGGNIALEVASTLPEYIAKTIVIGGNLFFEGMTDRVQKAILKTERQASRLSFIPKYKRVRDLYRLMSQQPEITAEKLKLIASPTLLLAGERDMVKEEHTQLMQRLITNSKLVIIQGGNHFLLSSKTDETFEEIEAFLH